MGVYVGMDVHRKRSQVALLDHDGTQLANRNLPNDPTELIAILGRLEAGTPVAFEAAYGWGWLADLLAELGLEPHLAHPGGCKAIAAARLKDDRVDARTLAHLLRTDLLPEAWIAPPQVRDQRALLRHRAGLVRLRTTLKNRVHAVLADRGVRVQQPLWTQAGRAWLDKLALPAAPRAVIDDCVGLVDQLTPIIARVERDLLARATPDPRVQALMALPGVGRLTAMTLVAEIGDIGRFATARKLCAWAGLTLRCATPTARSATATSPSRAPRGCAGCWSKPPTRPPPSRHSPASSPSAPPAAAGRSPPWRWPASCSPARSMSSPRSRPPTASQPGRPPRRVRSQPDMRLHHGRGSD
jgi:transposase